MDTFQQEENSPQSVDVKDERIDFNSMHLNANLFGDFKDQLRQQLTVEKPSPQNDEFIHLCVHDAVSSMLTNALCNKEKLAAQLEAVFEAFTQVYESSDISEALRKRRYICETGLVSSPDHCTETIKDTLRMNAFVRGIDQAIHSLSQSVKGKINIVYPACGPFAPLLLPLLSYYQREGIYSSDDLSVSLIDIQDGAIQSVRSLIKALSIGGFIKEVVCCNAVSYTSNEPVHLVVLEALQHGFSREGHLKLAKHFADMLDPIGIFLPQEIIVSAVLNVGQREYVEQWQQAKTEEEKMNLINEVRAERTELGDILRVNLPMLRKMSFQRQDEHTELYECGSVELPYLEKEYDQQVLMISSKVNVFNDEKIDEYDSGITHPLPDLQVCVNFVPKDSRPGDLLVKSGDVIKFYYCMNGLPGFLPIKLEKQNGNGK